MSQTKSTLSFYTCQTLRQNLCQKIFKIHAPSGALPREIGASIFSSIFYKGFNNAVMKFTQ